LTGISATSRGAIEASDTAWPAYGKGFPDGPLKTTAESVDYNEIADAGIETEDVFTFFDLNWQAQCCYDPINHLIHVMSKPAASSGGDGAWGHRYYDIRNDTWVTVFYRDKWSDSGHIYDNLTIDPATGDLFLGWDAHVVKHFVAADRDWTNEIDPFPVTSSIAPHDSGMAWHPHLYGPNDGAFCLFNHDPGIAGIWRRSTNSVEEVSVGGGFGGVAGAGVYCEKANALIMGGDDGGNHFIVTPNATLGGTPQVTNVGAPPKSTAGTTYNDNYGVMVPHPQSGKVLLIDRETSNNVWETSDGDSWTQRSNYSMVASGKDSFVVCAIPELGVIFATGIADSPRVSMHKVWRPQP
jgi:hypothetical protein